MDENTLQALEVRALSGMLTKLAGQDLERRLQACGAEISGLQFGVLRRLSRRSATISELSDAMLLAPATLVPVVDALEQKGFVQRVADAHDRRRKSLTITPAGDDLLLQTPAIVQGDRLCTALAAIGLEDAGRLVDLLGQMVTHLSEDQELVSRIRANIRAQRN